MKKFLAVLFILLFTAGDAFATIEVSYNNAGARRTVAYGARTPQSAHNFGGNAAFLPHNTVRAGARQRQIAYERAMIQAMNNMSRPSTQMSRFNKNYTVSTQKPYTRNGVTYYN